MANIENKELSDTLEKALATLEQSLTDKNLQKLVEQIVDSLKGAHITNRSVFEQLSALANYIASTRSEIAAIQADAINGQYIPHATDQLDEVVGATEEATNKIMDCCDGISAIAGELPAEQQTKLMDLVTRIFEACNFQDVTGQRITKVVRTLKHIETQIHQLVKSLEQVGFTFDKTPAQKIEVSEATDPEKHLLNGPQLTNDAIKQDDIDKLFG